MSKMMLGTPTHPAVRPPSGGWHWQPSAAVPIIAHGSGGWPQAKMCLGQPNWALTGLGGVQVPKQCLHMPPAQLGPGPTQLGGVPRPIAHDQSWPIMKNKQKPAFLVAKPQNGPLQVFACPINLVCMLHATVCEDPPTRWCSF